MQLEEWMELYRKEGSRYHQVDDSEIVGQAFVILAKRGMEDLVSQTIRRLFLLTEVRIEGIHQELEVGDVARIAGQYGSSVSGTDSQQRTRSGVDSARSGERHGEHSESGSSASDR